MAIAFTFSKDIILMSCLAKIMAAKSAPKVTPKKKDMPKAAPMPKKDKPMKDMPKKGC